MKSINHILSPESPSFTLFPPTSTPPTHTCTVPILQFYFLLLKFKLMFKGVSQCMLTVSTFLWSIQPLPLLSYPFTSHSPFFNSFHYTSLYSLLSQMLCFTILLMLYNSHFLSLFPGFHRVVPLLPPHSLHPILLWFLLLCPGMVGYFLAAWTLVLVMENEQSLHL
jgi:hypothetical protein